MDILSYLMGKVQNAEEGWKKNTIIGIMIFLILGSIISIGTFIKDELLLHPIYGIILIIGGTALVVPILWMIRYYMNRIEELSKIINDTRWNVSSAKTYLELMNQHQSSPFTEHQEKFYNDALEKLNEIIASIDK